MQVARCVHTLTPCRFLLVPSDLAWSSPMPAARANLFDCRLSPGSDTRPSRGVGVQSGPLPRGWERCAVTTYITWYRTVTYRTVSRRSTSNSRWNPTRCLPPPSCCSAQRQVFVYFRHLAVYRINRPRFPIISLKDNNLAVSTTGDSPLAYNPVPSQTGQRLSPPCPI